MSQLTFKAAFLKNRKVCNDFFIQDVTLSPPMNKEVRVKIMFTAICKTDLEYIRDPSKTIPNCGGNNGGILLGQEASGIVESVGPNVTYVKSGDHVIVLRIPQCDKCHLCRSNPKTNICEYTRTTGSHLRTFRTGEKLVSGDGIGSFSQYINIPVEYLTKIGPEFPLAHAAVIGTVYLSGYGAAMHKARVHPGSICAVFGLGALGLGAISGCKAAGAQLIICFDVNEEKFSNAKLMGGTHFLNPLIAPTASNDKFNRLLEEIDAPGFDYIFECTQKSAACKLAVANMTRWGTFVPVCYAPAPTSSYFSIIDNLQNIKEGQSFIGGLYGGLKPRTGVKSVIEDVLSKKINLDQFITRKIQLDEINKCFEWYKSGKKIVTLIEM